MHRRCTWIMMMACENRGADGLPVYWHHWFSMVVFILDEKLRPIVRRKFEKEFEYLRLLVGFADDVRARDVLGRVANHCRTLQSRRVESRRGAARVRTIVRLRLSIGIRQRGAAATRCKCRRTKASVSRLGLGSCWRSASNLCCLI